MDTNFSYFYLIFYVGLLEREGEKQLSESQTGPESSVKVPKNKSIYGAFVASTPCFSRYLLCVASNQNLIVHGDII